MPVTQWVGDQAVTVYFIGAGPGAADLITVRGQRLLHRCPVCLYAGSIMPDDLLALCPPDAQIVDTGPLTLDQIIDAKSPTPTPPGHDVARLHSGDPSLYSALAEQCRRLDALGIGYEIVPGVPAFAAAAAVARPGAHRARGGPDRDADAGWRRCRPRCRAGEDLRTLVGAGAHAGAAPGRRPGRRDGRRADRGRLRAETPMCGGGIRELAAGDGAAGHARPTSPGRCARPASPAPRSSWSGEVLAAEGFTDSYLYSAGRRRGARH